MSDSASNIQERPVAIVQARMGSTRLPGKVLMPLAGRPVLWHIVARLRHVPELANVVVATSELPSDGPVRDFCLSQGIPVFAGSEDDVLDRYYRAALTQGADPVIRVTGDCPFVDPRLVSRLIAAYRERACDHVGIAAGAGALHSECRFPDGLDAECFAFAALERAWQEASLASDREHVTAYIWRNKDIFRCSSIMAERDHSNLRLTIDHPADYDLMGRIYDALYREDGPFSLEDVLRFLAEHPDLSGANDHLIGQEGYEALWQVIPNCDKRKETVS